MPSKELEVVSRTSAPPKRKGVVRPRNVEQFTVEQMAEALRASRGFVSATARRLACDPATVYNYMERYPELVQVRRDAKEEEKDVAELALGKAVREGEGWAVCFFLKTQAKDRGYIERASVEHSGPEGGPIEIRPVVDASKLSTETLRRIQKEAGDA